MREQEIRELTLEISSGVRGSKGWAVKAMTTKYLVLRILQTAIVNEGVKKKEQEGIE